ncbi:MAG: DUF5052 family protein [Alphaproteobacteria bacterium]|nr:DUF5052 family protein [Alphaproteobacteria bacterium]
MKKIFLVAVLCAATISLSACSNTADGIERDMNKVGGKIKEAFPPKHA